MKIYLSILLSWANSSTFILTYGQRVSSKSSHLVMNWYVCVFCFCLLIINLIKFLIVVKALFSHTHVTTHLHTPQIYHTISLCISQKHHIWHYFHFMLYHTRPLSRVYVVFSTSLYDTFAVALQSPISNVVWLRCNQPPFLTYFCWIYKWNLQVILAIK